MLSLKKPSIPKLSYFLHQCFTVVTPTPSDSAIRLQDSPSSKCRCAALTFFLRCQFQHKNLPDKQFYFFQLSTWEVAYQAKTGSLFFLMIPCRSNTAAEELLISCRGLRLQQANRHPKKPDRKRAARRRMVLVQKRLRRPDRLPGFARSWRHRSSADFLP